MTRRGTRRISGVTVLDYGALFEEIHKAAEFSENKDTAGGELYLMLKAAIGEARKGGGFGVSSTGDVLAAVTLDEKLRTLIAAEFYICHGEYRDTEAFT